MDTQQQLSRQTLFLHWLVAFGIIGMLALGIYMDETEAFALYPWHKSFGVLLFAFILWRVYWRMKNGWLKPVRQYKPFEITLAKVVHWVLIIGTVLMPVSGMMMSGLGGHGIPFFGLELMASNPDPADPAKVVPINETLAGLGKAMHGLGGTLIIVAVLLHIAGALKHHFIDKDDTLKRMTGVKVAQNKD